MKIAVVGAGISGLSCAYRLVQAGQQVTLFEAGDYFGGHSNTVDITLDGMVLGSGQVVLQGSVVTELLQGAVATGAVLTCVQTVGALGAMIEQTIDYLATRIQFGAALSTFQALKHRIADVKMQQELGRSMSYYASLKLGEPGPQRRRALSQAKVQLGRSMRHVGQECTQIHGGIGVTDEYVSSHYFKRLTVLEMAYGDTMHHLGEVSARMQDSAGVFA